MGSRFATASLAMVRAGTFKPRKAIPSDVRAAYAQLYGQRWEAIFSAPTSTPPAEAKAAHAEWLALVERRIADAGITTTLCPLLASRPLWSGWQPMVGLSVLSSPLQRQRRRNDILALLCSTPTYSISSPPRPPSADGVLCLRYSMRYLHRSTRRTQRSSGLTVSRRPSAAPGRCAIAGWRLQGRSTDGPSAGAWWRSTRSMAAWYAATRRDVERRPYGSVLRLTPEAGTIKTGKVRIVPIHAHLFELGFPQFTERAFAADRR